MSKTSWNEVLSSKMTCIEHCIFTHCQGISCWWIFLNLQLGLMLLLLVGLTVKSEISIIIFEVLWAGLWRDQKYTSSYFTNKYFFRRPYLFFKLLSFQCITSLDARPFLVKLKNLQGYFFKKKWVKADHWFIVSFLSYYILIAFNINHFKWLILLFL